MKYIKSIAFLLTMTNCCFGSDKQIRKDLAIQGVVVSHIVKKLNESGDKWYKSLKYDETLLKVIPKIISDVYLKKNPLYGDMPLKNQSNYNYVVFYELFKDKINNKDKPLEDLFVEVCDKLYKKYANKCYIDKAISDVKAYVYDLGLDKLLVYYLSDRDKLFGFFKSGTYGKTRKGYFVVNGSCDEYLSNVYIHMKFDHEKQKITYMKLGCHEYDLDHNISDDMYLYDIIKNYNPKHNILLKTSEPGVRTYLNLSDREITANNQDFDKDGNVTVTYKWDKKAKNDYVEFERNNIYDISGIKLTELGKKFKKELTIVIEGDTYGHETKVAPNVFYKLQHDEDNFNAIKIDAKVNLVFKKKNNRNVLIYHYATNYCLSDRYGIFYALPCLTTVDLSGAIFVCRAIDREYRNNLCNDNMFYGCINLSKVIWNTDVKTALSCATNMFANTSLEEIDLSAFYATELLTSISGICENCKKLNYVNLSSLSKYDRYGDPIITESKSAFYKCAELKEIQLCDLRKCRRFDGILYKCPKDIKMDTTKLPENFKLQDHIM